MAAKTVNEMKADLVQATLATWIQLVQEKGYENTDASDTIDTTMRKSPELFSRLREAVPSEVSGIPFFEDSAEVAEWLLGVIVTPAKKRK
jgi:hypothetical protein